MVDESDPVVWENIDIDEWNPWWSGDFSRLSTIRSMVTQERRSDYRYHFYSALAHKLTVIDGPARSGKTTTLVQLADDILGGKPGFTGWEAIREGTDAWDAVDPNRIDWWDERSGLESEHLIYVPLAEPLVHSSLDNALVELVERYEETVIGEANPDSHRVILLDDVDQYPSGRTEGSWQEQIDQLLTDTSGRHIVVSTSAFDREASPLNKYGPDSGDRQRNVSTIVASKFFDYTVGEQLPEYVADRTTLKERIYELRDLLAKGVEQGDLEEFVQELRTFVDSDGVPRDHIRGSLGSYLYDGGIARYSRESVRRRIEQTVFRKIVQSNDDIDKPGKLFALCGGAARYPPERTSFADWRDRVGFDSNTSPKDYVETLADYHLVNPIYKLNHDRTRSVYLYLQNPGYVNALCSQSAADAAANWSVDHGTGSPNAGHIAILAQTALANHLQRLMAYGFGEHLEETEERIFGSRYDHPRRARCWTDVNCDVEFVVQPVDRLLPIAPAFDRSLEEAATQLSRFTFRASPEDGPDDNESFPEYDPYDFDEPDPDVGVVVDFDADVELLDDGVASIPLWLMLLLS